MTKKYKHSCGLYAVFHSERCQTPEHTLSEGENVIEFTPSKSGTFQYTCWMGMIRGNITVTDTLETSPTDPDTSTGAEETDPETEPFFNGSGMGCCGS